MLKLETIGPVTKIKLARALLGRPLYFTAAYWVDGLLIDTGCAYTEREIMQALEGLPVECVVNTHSPDHICLYEPDEGWLFSGDLYIGGRDRALRADYNICAIVDSLKKIALLEVSHLFPGSGTVRENPSEDLLERID
jgi:glyoxylase-like metal-dependent hydrolase (beta-lactamase superfamily II)